LDILRLEGAMRRSQGGIADPISQRLALLGSDPVQVAGKSAKIRVSFILKRRYAMAYPSTGVISTFQEAALLLQRGEPLKLAKLHLGALLFGLEWPPH